MQLSAYFTLEEATFSETASRLGINNQPNEVQLSNMKAAASKLDLLRSSIDRPIRVSSWLRNGTLNAAIPGSSRTSAHMEGWAIDCTASGLTPLDLCIVASQICEDYDQIIHEYGSWMHISFDPKNRKQRLTIFKNNQGKKYIGGLLTQQEYINA